MISFTSLADYMWYLRLICERIGSFGPRAMLYLAAAVSDFYIPASEMPEHKLQSSEGMNFIHQLFSFDWVTATQPSVMHTAQTHS